MQRGCRRKGKLKDDTIAIVEDEGDGVQEHIDTHANQDSGQHLYSVGICARGDSLGFRGR